MSYLTEKVRKERDRLTRIGVADSTIKDVLIKLEALDREADVRSDPEQLTQASREIANQAIDGTLSAPDTFNAMAGLYRAYIEALEKRLGIPMSEAEAKAILMDYAKGKVRHRYMGQCPDDLEGQDVRDEDCQVCRALVTLEAFGR